MNKTLALLIALTGLSFAAPAFAADPMGLDVIPFDGKVMMLENVEKTYDKKNPERLIAVTGTTAAAPNVIINYYHSILMQRGWKSVGTVSAQGARMVREDEQISMNTGMDTGQYHTRFFIRLESVHLNPEGVPQ